MTSKVVKISELQEIFSEKILQQSADIEHIHTQVSYRGASSRCRMLLRGKNQLFINELEPFSYIVVVVEFGYGFLKKFWLMECFALY